MSNNDFEHYNESKARSVAIAMGALSRMASALADVAKGAQIARDDVSASDLRWEVKDIASRIKEMEKDFSECLEE